jgi:acyl-CoA synthetase (AMP-forming)/AMP-acid ligase II
MMGGYYGREKETAAASWFDAEGRRFQRSGDNGWFDGDGFLHLLDRKKDVIISGGFNVYAIDLENVLMRHPDVAEAAVIAAPSREWGETPVAYVVLRGSASSEEIRLWANERLGKSQRITRIIITEELPRSPIGKVLKRELRERFAKSSG